jgi:hypothetical protein
MVKGLRPDFLRGRQLGPSLSLRTDADRLPSAPPRQLGQRRQCRLGPAEVIDELAERHGSDVVAADQSQARQPLGRIERGLRQRRRR